MQNNEVIEIVRGDALNIVFDVNGIDFNGKQARSHFKKSGNNAADLVFTTNDGSIVVNIISTSHSTLTFSKTATQMANIMEGTYKYDIEVYTNNDDVITICKGSVNIIKDITT